MSGIRPEFGSHQLSEQGVEKMNALRVAFSDLLNICETICSGPDGGRELALAKTHLEDAQMRAQRAMAVQVANHVAKAISLCVLVFAGPAFAQDTADAVTVVPALPAPTNWLQGIIAALFSTLLPGLVVAIRHIQVSTANSRFNGAVERITTLIEAQVSRLYQQFTEAAADGKITPEELAAILDELKKTLPPKLMAIVTGEFGSSVQAWLEGIVMDAITQRQTAVAEAAGAHAEAQISSLNAALKARAVRAVTP